MAQFSSLESMNNVESAITGMDDSFHKSLTVQTEASDALKGSAQSIADALSAQNVNSLGLNNALTASLIGKDVRVKVDQVLMGRDQDGNMPSKRLNIHTDSPANDVKVRIVDSNNKLVRTINTETITQTKFNYNKDYADHFVVWDGKNDAGETVAAGTYTVSIEAKLGTSEINANVFEQGMVGGIDYTPEGVLLQVKCKDYDNDGEFYVTTMPVGYITSVREHTEG
jgi:flagellar hook assembly protein FlgD